MKAEEIQKYSEEELVRMEQDLVKDYFHLKFQFFTGQLENTARMTGVKRDIARVKTILHQRKKLKDVSHGDKE